MLKSLTRDIMLMVQARTGVTAGVIVWLAIVAIAALAAFIFLCVAGYDWLALKFGSVFGGLIMAGVFIVIALIGLIVCAGLRKRTRERAILERAARAHTPSWLLDPRLLSTAMQIGRQVGWQRIMPVALLGFMAAQWTREYRQQHNNKAAE